MRIKGAAPFAEPELSFVCTDGRASQFGLRAKPALGRDKMNISEYPFSTFIGIDVSKDTLDIAELKGAAGKTIGNNKKDICRWITSLKETSQTIVVMATTSRSVEPGAESTPANHGCRDP